MNYTVSLENEEIVMKLLHYFITVKNYNPVVLQGAKNEIWLEKLDGDYKIIRIVSNYIHNNEQLNFDLYRTKKIMKSIKKKTFSIKIPTLTFFLNLGDNVKMEEKSDYITCLNIKNIDDITSNNIVLSSFPDIKDKLVYSEEGMELFLKLTKDINKKTESDAIKAEEVFKIKYPVVTIGIILINIFIFLIMYIFGKGSQDSYTLIKFGANNQYFVLQLKEYYRLFTSMFLHIGILHLFVNCYSLFIVGSQIESFFGKIKYIIIYIFSGLCGSLLSICFSNSISAGASGAIFGLLGSLLYFGYHHRLYLNNAIRKQIIPLIVYNLLLGFLISGIDNAAHIGGLLGGILISMACGVKYKSTKTERINGIILSLLFVVFIVFLTTMI